MPKVDAKFETLEAFEDAAKLAAKVNRFAFARKDTAVNEVIDGGIICTKDIINEHACIRYALNEARCPEVLIVDATYKTNIYKFPLVSAIGINNVSNKKEALASFQIAMAWMENESEASYTWFLQTLCTEIYNTYSCLPNIFMSDKDQALRNASSKVFSESNKMLCVWHILEQNLKANCCKLFKTNDDYEAFKKEVVGLHFTTVEEQISQSLNSVKKAAEKAYTPEKVESYIQTLMKDSKMWISAYTKWYCNMGISTTGCCESSHSAFKRAIETASNLNSVFRKIDQTMCLQHLKASMRTGSNKVINNIKRTLQKMAKPNIYENNRTCECSSKFKFKLSCPHIIPKDSPIPLLMIDKRWFLERSKITELLHPSKSSIIDPEFYSTFVKAEEKFEQLSDIAAKMEFITKL
ncbi:4980_t:CDS:2 [Cetraspora pellucida]|uniref:4980_t:CDS:1 n=1 Tax=Cetraspora pellucida TaxID=1433469 RepID=A0A9N9BEI8_9GLOM|nr:4980_t:CDS:2 [Cetraspora pellucida]